MNALKTSCSSKCDPARTRGNGSQPRLVNPGICVHTRSSGNESHALEG